MLDIVRETIVFGRIEEISQCLALIRQVCDLLSCRVCLRFYEARTRLAQYMHLTMSKSHLVACKGLRATIVDNGPARWCDG